jgi:predicted NBD/HSP70 family sugar kinase
MSLGCNLTAHGATARARKIDLNNFRVATARTARDINRRIVLNLIRKHQPISRAELSRHSRLQRSTVSSITEQLIAERWVRTGATEDTPRGRKPTYLHLNGDRAGIVGVDIRPGRTTITLAGLDMRFVTQESMSTGDDPQAFIEDLSQRVCSLVSSYPHIAFEGIGVALPGRVDLRSNRLAFAPNLGWDAIDLKTPLEQATGLPVELENAANACALAEIWSSRHPESVHNLMAITVSEGIGVGMILNGELVRGSSGMAGEFGHVTIQEDGPACKCGNRGCLEVCASNTAAVRYYDESASGHGGRQSASQTTFDLILRLADQGDRIACEALDRMAHALGAGIAMIIAGLAPDVVVIVGEVTRAWNRVGPTISRVVTERSATGAKTQIVPADPNTQPRVRGTIALVLQKHFGAFHI